VHRDLKARNVLFAGDDSVRLVDFGSALGIGQPWTPGGTTVVAPDRGTVPVGVADDVHALAALLHELIHGAPYGMGRSPGKAAAVAPLSAVVDECLDSYPHAGNVGLEGFRTVIESLRQRSLGQP
jgi:serine/threonine protein kinase